MFEAVKSQVDSVSNTLWRDPPRWLDLAKEHPCLGRRSMREMQAAPQPRERRIKAGEAVTGVRAAQGENPLLPHAMEPRQDMETDVWTAPWTLNRVSDPKELLIARKCKTCKLSIGKTLSSSEEKLGWLTILGMTRKCQDKTDISFKNLWSVNKRECELHNAVVLCKYILNWHVLKLIWFKLYKSYISCIFITFVFIRQVCSTFAV